MFEKLFAGTLMALVIWQPGAANATTAVPVSLPQLPATFSGTLPCASCEGIETSITLQSDGTFFPASATRGKFLPIKPATWDVG